MDFFKPLLHDPCSFPYNTLLCAETGEEGSHGIGLVKVAFEGQFHPSIMTSGSILEGWRLAPLDNSEQYATGSEGHSVGQHFRNGLLKANTYFRNVHIVFKGDHFKSNSPHLNTQKVSLYCFITC